jgi:putative NADH-flavin reductase
MRIAVLGASGRTGALVIARALARGHDVGALVRDPAAVAPADGPVEAIAGDARDAERVDALLAGAEAVISAMGPSGPDPSTRYSDAIGTVVSEMGTADPRRLVLSANVRVLDDRPLTGAYAGVSEEHRRALSILRRNGPTRWTVVATRMLTDGPAAGSYDAAIEAAPPGKDIAREDFATALLDALDRDDWVGQVVGVSGA